MVEVTVCGIPALAEVTHFAEVKPWRGSPQTCPSADDYYGFTEIEFDLYDRKGYRAYWLERKLDALPEPDRQEQTESIEQELLDARCDD